MKNIVTPRQMSDTHFVTGHSGIETTEGEYRVWLMFVVFLLGVIFGGSAVARYLGG